MSQGLVGVFEGLIRLLGLDAQLGQLIIALRVLGLQVNDFLERGPGLGIIAFEGINVPQGDKIKNIFVVGSQIPLDSIDGAVIVFGLEKHAIKEFPGLQKVRFELQRLLGVFLGQGRLLVQQVGPGQEQPGPRVLGTVLGEETETVHRGEAVFFAQGDDSPGFGGLHVLGVSLQNFICQLLGHLDLAPG